jgi:hypothetical protein
MDQIVFDEYIKRRGRNLVGAMEDGILHSGIDWLNTSKPTGKHLPLFYDVPPDSQSIMRLDG